MHEHHRARRRSLLIGSGVLGLAACASATPASAGPRQSDSLQTKAVEMTFLQSLNPDPTLAACFIRANWFAMDAVAQARGLMTSYTLHIDPAPHEAWNMVVQVGYPDERGFDSIQAHWAEIRAAHKTVLIDGKGLPDLARILGTRRLLPA